MFDFIQPCEQKWVHSFISLQVPKTASSAINKCCGERNLIQKHRRLFEATFGKHPLYRGVFDVRHCTPEHVVGILGRQVFDYFSFAVVRNPFERLSSAYRFGRKMKLHGVYGLSEDCSFEQFIDFLYGSWIDNRQDVLVLKPQTAWTHSSVFRPKEVLKFENLDKEWPQMLENYGIKGLPPLTKENTTDRSQSPDWNRELVGKVVEMFEKDFELLGYSKTLP
jgi:hypothetical protein